jgi:hypothetical protein
MKIKISFSILMALLLTAGLQGSAKSYITVSTLQPSDSLKLVEFTGKYIFKANPTIQYVNIKIEKNGLLATGPDDTVYNLEKDAQKADTFTISDLDAEVYFVRDAAKKITGMKVLIQEQELIAVKELTKN